MIPSEFNQDAIMQRRWTKRLLREVRKPMTTGPSNRRTWLDVHRDRIGNWFVGRVEGIGGKVDQLAGPFRAGPLSRNAAQAAAKKIAAKTKEPIGNPFSKSKPRPGFSSLEFQAPRGI